VRILISGYHNPHYVTVTEYIERAVRSIGHDVITFNDRDHIFPGRLRKKISLLQKLSVVAINRGLLKLAAQIRPDVVLVIGGHRIAPNALRRLSGLKARVVLWTTDAPHASDMMLTTAPLYHHIFCQGTEYMDIFHRMRLPDAEWLPMACDPEVHRPVEIPGEEQRRFGSDVVFVGSYYPCRVETLQAVARRHLAVWGPGWEVLPWHSPLRISIRGAHTPPDIWARIYAASNIVLSIHYSNSGNRIPVHQASPRIFEAMACGAFVLTDRQKDVLTLFKDGLHLVAFSDTEDLNRKIAYYLEHSAERQRIAAAGRNEVLQNHTYEHRADHLLSRIKVAAAPVSGFPATTAPACSLSIAG
jgi:spore maturation protein CgeB